MEAGKATVQQAAQQAMQHGMDAFKRQMQQGITLVQQAAQQAAQHKREIWIGDSVAVSLV